MKKYIYIVLIGLISMAISCSKTKKEKQESLSKESSVELLKISTELETETIEIELEYFGWTCPCAQWISPENKKIFEKKRELNIAYGDSLFYYIIPSSDTITQPFDLINNTNNLNFKFSGRFFKEMQYMNVEGEKGPAITFKYDKVEIVR